MSGTSVVTAVAVMLLIGVVGVAEGKGGGDKQVGTNVAGVGRDGTLHINGIGDIWLCPGWNGTVYVGDVDVLATLRNLTAVVQELQRVGGVPAEDQVYLTPAHNDAPWQTNGALNHFHFGVNEEDRWLINTRRHIHIVPGQDGTVFLGDLDLLAALDNITGKVQTLQAEAMLAGGLFQAKAAQEWTSAFGQLVEEANASIVPDEHGTLHLVSIHDVRFSPGMSGSVFMGDMDVRATLRNLTRAVSQLYGPLGPCAGAAGAMSCSVSSCLDVKKLNPNARSGVYSIRPIGFTRKPTLNVYCDMDTDGGGWTRTGHLNEDQITEIRHDDANNMLDASELGYRSFSGLWFKTQPTTAMIFHYVGGGGSDYGAGHRIRITWNDSPFTYGNYNNHLLEDCRNLDTGTVWSNCRYASHASRHWQGCSFSFTSNNLRNRYYGSNNRRIILGPTARFGAGDCDWHNFGADTNPRNIVCIVKNCLFNDFLAHGPSRSIVSFEFDCSALSFIFAFTSLGATVAVRP